MGLEAWKKLRDIFLGQGKYVVEILNRFLMEYYKPTDTPMITNKNKVISS
jgi:hypothetical protein